MLKPIKDSLENTIKQLTKTSLTRRKITEVTLKVKIDATKGIPDIEYTISQRLKEEKNTFKDYINNKDCLLKVDEEGEVRIEEMNKQENLFN